MAADPGRPAARAAVVSQNTGVVSQETPGRQPRSRNARSDMIACMSAEAAPPEFTAELSGLIDRDARVERVCTGSQFTEGPIWNPREQCLYFSDIPASIRYRWNAADGVSEARNPTNRANGMTYDGAGNLYICEHNTSSLVRESPSGGRHIVASHWKGRQLNSPNDVVVRSDDSVYFSDPSYGRLAEVGIARPQDLAF